jgi:hypothetical protein
MKKFTDINDLHAFLERQARRTIKYYYTDWKNYDRPEIMKHTGLKTREIYIILRESGSYLYTREDLSRNYPAAVMDYYSQDATAKYYKVDFNRLTVERIPAGLPEDIRRENDERRRAA